MEPLHAVFDSYKLDELDREWINQVCDSGFTNIDNVPIDYLMFLESTDMQDLLRATCAIVKDWISKDHDVRTKEHEEVSWETLIAMNLEVRALLSVLAHTIKRGQAFDASQETRLSCLSAASLYFVLLAIPGSNAFQAFQPDLYELALRSLELSRLLIESKKALRPIDTEQRSEDSAGDEDNTEFSIALSGSQAATLTRGLNAVMYDLVTMLDIAVTTMELRSLEVTIYHLMEMTKLANETIDLKAANRASASSLAYNAYVALEKICNTKYSSVRTIARLIAKYALPQFLIAGEKNFSKKRMALIRESTLYFFQNLLVKHGQEAKNALVILLQHLMIKFPDKSDGRQRQASVIVKLLNICCDDEVSLKLCILDLARMSHHVKISHRIFAQEIIGKFIMEFTRNGSPSGARNNENSCSARIEEILLASALGRCTDASSMVRGRAIATLAEYTDFHEKPEVRRLFATRHDDSIVEIPSLEKIEESIEGNVVESLLPDARQFMNILKIRLDDERASVRKSALRIILNGVRISPLLLDTAAPLVRKHCRDSVLTVRRYAMRVLTNLLEYFPDTPGLCENWVDSVIPGIFDNETKVQEEVLDSLEKLTIGKITNYTADDDETNDLPWNILIGIAANDMCDHLSRACSAWIDNDKITERTIMIVKSHVDTRNNVGAWLLLASISDSRKIRKIENHCAFYDRTDLESTNYDIFHGSLVLRVLKNSWSTFDETTLSRISRDLANCLKNYRIDVALVRQCIDIVHDITRHLAVRTKDENLTDITRELAISSEGTIQRIVESSSDEDTNNSLFRAICTLGHSLFVSWTRISLEMRRLLQRFLLEWKSLPSHVRKKKELQGAAIIVLGQQALVDRDIAVEMTPIFGRLLCNERKSLSRQNGGSSLSRDGVTLPEQNGAASHRRNGVDSLLDNNALDDYENMANGPVVRINAAKALADICARFTSLVEPYLGDMCTSMKDPNPQVRQVILVIFIQLLVEDTIMIKEAFFFHILTMLADDDSAIRRMTIFLIKERLIAKNKNLINQQFLNGIFHFNDCTRRGDIVKRRRAKRSAADALSLAGTSNTKKRQIIYDFMLENLDPPGKFIIIVKLTKYILNPRENNNLDVRCEKVISVIRDAFYILASDYLHVNSFSKQSNDDETNEEAGNNSANSVIVEAIRRHRGEIFLPTIVELRRHCELRESSLIMEITKFLGQAIFDSSKDALTNLYNEYPKLEQEIQRECRKYSKRPCEETVENDDESGYFETPKKFIREKHTMLIDPDRMPRIVLRRLSSLTYPGNSACSAKTCETGTDDSRDLGAVKISEISNITKKKSSRC